MVVNKYKIELLKSKISECVNGIVIPDKLNIEVEYSWLDKIDVILENTLIKYSKEEVEKQEFLIYFIEKLDENNIYIGYYHQNRKVIDVILTFRNNIEHYELCKKVEVIVHEREFEI